MKDPESNSLLDHLQFLNIGLFSTVRFSQSRDGLGILNQSIGEHKIGMQNIVDVTKRRIDERFDVNWDVVDKMIRYHDVGEIKSGEITCIKKNDHDRLIEQNALEEILENFPEELGTEIYELLREKEERKTIEAKIVYAIDKIEPGILIATERGIAELRDLHKQIGSNLIAFEVMRYKMVKNLLIEWELDVLLELFEETWERQLELGLLQEDPQLKLELETDIENEKSLEGQQETEETVEIEQQKEREIEQEKNKEEV